MLRTTCELFGIDYPILSAGMAAVAMPILLPGFRSGRARTLTRSR